MPLTKKPFHAIFVLFWLLLTLLFNGCSTQPITASQKPTKEMGQNLSEFPESEINIEKSAETLQEDLKIAQNDQAWVDYYKTLEVLWQKLPDAEQPLLERTGWKTLQTLSADDLKALADSQSEVIADWLALLAAHQQPAVWQKSTLRDLAMFSPDTSFSHHLIPEWINQLNHPTLPHQVAVLLPFTGPYANIATQIRNGIIKNEFATAPETALKFYNVANKTDQIAKTYQTAIEKGADVILGPLTKAAIMSLSESYPSLSDKFKKVKIIVLNQVGNTPFTEFNFKSDNEAEQIAQQLCAQSYNHIGILSSASLANTDLASKIQQLWLQNNHHSATLKTYPTKHPDLRRALGSVINENQSQARKNNLRWLLKEQISFTPRTRHDLDAIVLVGNRTNLAVFKPQFKFYNLKLPVYGTSNLTPNPLHQEKPDRDLANITFPTFPAALHPSPVTTVFEAYGWDSFTLATHPDRLAPGLCDRSGQTGALILDGQNYDHRLSWAKYSATGKIKALE